MSTPTYHRADVCEAARKHYRRKEIALEETDGVFRLRSMSGNWARVDGLARETDVVEYGSRFKSLADVARSLGVARR